MERYGAAVSCCLLAFDCEIHDDDDSDETTLVSFCSEHDNV